MLKKLFAFSLITCLFVVQAHATTHNGLKAAFDDLNYALSVEWDQQDRSFYDAQMEKFKSTLSSLQGQGLSNQELVDFTLSQVKNEKLAKDLETAFTMISINKMSQSEAQRYVTEVMNRSYNQGASWNGGAVVGVLVAVILVAVALIVAGKARVNENEGCYEVYTCEDYCTAGWCYEDCYYECVN